MTTSKAFFPADENFPFTQKFSTKYLHNDTSHARIMIGNSLFVLKIVQKDNIIRVCEVIFPKQGLEYKIKEYNDLKIDQNDEEKLVIKLMVVGELNGFLYLFTNSQYGSIQSLEQIHRLKIVDSHSIVMEKIYESSEHSYIRVASPLLADRERNCFYWFGGINSTTLKDCIKFNLETCKFEHLTNFAMGYVFHSQSSVFWKNRFIITFGGWISSCMITSNIFAYDVENSNWYSIYSIDDWDEDIIPTVYRRYNSGMTLVSNRWASKFDETIPCNDEEDTLFIYGGHIDSIIEDHEYMTGDTNEILLFHLDESTFKLGEIITETRIPFNLTKYCKDLYEKKLKEKGVNNLEEVEFQILPPCGESTIHNFKGDTGRESIYILGINRTDLTITKLDLSDIRSIFSHVGDLNNYDVKFSFSN